LSVPVQVIAWRTVSAMTCNVSSGTLNLTYSLTRNVVDLTCCSSFLSDINCGDETSGQDLSSLYEMLGNTPKMTTPSQPASVHKRRSLGELLYTCILFLFFIYWHRGFLSRAAKFFHFYGIWHRPMVSFIFPVQIQVCEAC